METRASDADRERAAETLRRAGGAGKLDVDELDQRLDAVYAARTHGELVRLTEDVNLGRPVSGGPRVRLRIVSIMGGTDVRRGRKLSRRERKRLHH